MEAAAGGRAAAGSLTGARQRIDREARLQISPPARSNVPSPEEEFAGVRRDGFGGCERKALRPPGTEMTMTEIEIRAAALRVTNRNLRGEI